MERRKWSKEDINFIKKQLEKGKSYKEIAEVLGCEENAIRVKAYYFAGEYNDRTWDESDDEYLKSNFHKTDKEIANDLKKFVGTITHHRRKLDLGRNYRWSARDDQLIRDPDYKVRELSEILGRTQASIYMRRKKLGVSKPRNLHYGYVDGNSILNALYKKYGLNNFYTIKQIKDL